MKSRKAFTLVELLVAMACAVVILATLSFTMYFIVQINRTVVENASYHYRLSEMQDFVRKNVHSVDNEPNFRYDEGEQKLYYEESSPEKTKQTVILHDVELVIGEETKFLYTGEDGFCYFRVTYLTAEGDEKVYQFILN